MASDAGDALVVAAHGNKKKPEKKTQDSLESISLYLTMRSIMQDAGDGVAKHKHSKRKLDIYGNIKSYSGLVNNPQRLKNMSNAMKLADSLSQIKWIDQVDKAKKTNDLNAEQQLLAPKARDKLISNGLDANKLSKKEIASLLFVYYSVDMLPNGAVLKAEFIKQLLQEKNENEGPSWLHGKRFGCAPC
jgi:hypothetical protein